MKGSGKISLLQSLWARMFFEIGVLEGIIGGRYIINIRKAV